MPSGKYLAVIPKSNPVAPVCFAVSGFAFLASIVGLIVNHWLSGWMAVGGMAGIGLFYLAIGLLSVGSRVPVYTAPVPCEDDNRTNPPDADDMQESVLVGSTAPIRPLIQRSRNEQTLKSVE